MQSMPAARSTLLAIVAVAAALAVTATAAFSAPRPGADLRPIGSAADLVQLVQGNESVLWTSLSGTVTGYTVQGWPSRKGGNELGGALMMERLEPGADAGVVTLGEKPMSLSFEVDG